MPDLKHMEQYLKSCFFALYRVYDPYRAKKQKSMSAKFKINVLCKLFHLENSNTAEQIMKNQILYVK